MWIFGRAALSPSCKKICRLRTENRKQSNATENNTFRKTPFPGGKKTQLNTIPTGKLRFRAVKSDILNSFDALLNRCWQLLTSYKQCWNDHDFVEVKWKLGRVEKIWIIVEIFATIVDKLWRLLKYIEACWNYVKIDEECLPCVEA